MNKSKELLNLLEVMKKGKVVKNNSFQDKPIDLGFVKVGKDEIAFTPNTKFGKGASFKALKIGTSVLVEIEDTSRGLHAKALELV